MSEHNNEILLQDPPISLRKSVGIYAVFLAVFGLSAKLAVSTTWFPGTIAVFAYLAFGFLLNRIVLRNLVEWHPMHNTIENVARAKLAALFLWPISYANLFFKLAVDRVL